mmetsp:Transcript_27290/g.70250  ORF Transcript_27290/g.70250 Transcript_27290/m.70250 type:complete len:111 (-) Transcript_27290:83-415(-)
MMCTVKKTEKERRAEDGGGKKQRSLRKRGRERKEEEREGRGQARSDRTSMYSLPYSPRILQVSSFSFHICVCLHAALLVPTSTHPHRRTVAAHYIPTISPLSSSNCTDTN